MSDSSSVNSHVIAFWVGSCKNVIISVAVVLGVACSWTAATQFSQRTLTVSPDHFNAPYFSMWFGTNFMLCCYPVYLIYELCWRHNLVEVHRDACRVFALQGKTFFQSCVTIFCYVAPFNLFWICANYTFSRALMVIAASVATAISSCNAAMVYILSMLFLREGLLATKTASVLLAMAGVIVMSTNLPSSSENKTPWLGVLLSTASAFSAAVYKVAFKRIIKRANLGQVSLFMTCLGFFNLTLNWIPTLILLETKVEHIDWSFVPWGYMCGSAALSLLFNFLLNFGVALLSPLVPSIGMLVGIPINTVCDVIFNHVDVNTVFVIGTVLIGLSFVLIILPLDDWRYNQLYIFVLIYVLYLYGKDYFVAPSRGFHSSENYAVEYKVHLLNLGIIRQSNFVNIEKMPLPDLTFVTALSENHAKEGRQLVMAISTKYPRKKVLVFDIGLSKRSRKWYEEACNVELRSVNLAKFGVSNLCEYRWKPIIIAIALKEFPAVFWMDTSTNFREPFNPMIAKLPLVPTEPNVFFLSRTSHSLYAATHPGMYKYLASESTKLMKPMGESGKVIWYRTQTTYKALKLWVLCALEKECMAPSGAHLHCKFGTKDEIYELGNCHKYDQAALNLILNSCQSCNSTPDLAWKYVYTNRSQGSSESVQPKCSS